PLTRPRPGHADLAGMQKYGYTDARPILERASARETAARVALGTVAKALLRQGLGIEVVSHVVELGTVVVKPGVQPRPEDAVRVRAAMKPISSLNRPLSTVDVTTGEPATAINQRSDVCAVPAAAVVAETMVALALAAAAVEKFGGDSVPELRRNLRGYLDTLVIR